MDDSITVPDHAVSPPAAPQHPARTHSPARISQTCLLRRKQIHLQNKQTQISSTQENFLVIRLVWLEWGVGWGGIVLLAVVTLRYISCRISHPWVRIYPKDTDSSLATTDKLQTFPWARRIRKKWQLFFRLAHLLKQSTGRTGRADMVGGEGRIGGRTATTNRVCPYQACPCTLSQPH